MAPLQSHAGTHSVSCLNTLEKDSHQQQQQEQQQPHYSKDSPTSSAKRNSFSTNERRTNLETALGNTKCETSSLKPSSSSLQLATLSSSGSIRGSSPSRRSAHSLNSGNTAKHEQSSAAASATAAATSTEKEKRKEVSSSRVKKFQRHFSQVSKDEKLINYFSCALVSDILLQGHLYITDRHFAFYSNVFGYVTKVVIPTSSVTKISKEKTAKIIPNAVGVATADERHVFGSFISREAAFRLMCSVCPPLAPAEILPKLPADIEISEEYSIEDDSSCSISGNESPPQALEGLAAASAAGDASQKLLRRTVVSSSMPVSESKTATGAKLLRHSDIPANAKTATSLHATNSDASRISTLPAPYSLQLSSTSSPRLLLSSSNTTLSSVFTTPNTLGCATSLPLIIADTASTSTTSASSTPTPNSSSTTIVVTKPKSAARAAVDSFAVLSKKVLHCLKFPRELHVVYVGVFLSVILALFSVFLLYRILDIEAKTSAYRSSVDFNWRSGNDEEIFAEALRWQKELQTKSTEEAQHILATNLEKIAKVRRSLETLSMLIHDRSASYTATNVDDRD